MIHALDKTNLHCCNIFCITALTNRTGLGNRRGCYKDLPVRAMEILEGKDHLLAGSYKTRKNAIEKCVLVGRGRGYPIVGIQDGGMCVGSPTLKDYNKYGISHDCKSNGRGGPWATEVHAFTWEEGRLAHLIGLHGNSLSSSIFKFVWDQPVNPLTPKFSPKNAVLTFNSVFGCHDTTWALVC